MYSKLLTPSHRTNQSKCISQKKLNALKMTGHGLLDKSYSMQNFKMVISSKYLYKTFI